ncbi:MAG: C1 family peptidase, partial [Dongiaceae bacterium]
QRNVKRSASPRMLYEMARRYDEWPGERYEGSSARGAMKGWLRHGVCPALSWPQDMKGARHFTDSIAEEARGTPGGAFYRVMHKQVRDMHAALAEVGILYITLMVHEGWHKPGPDTVPITYVESGNLREINLPVIRRAGRAENGHAVAIVGYTQRGFIVQNSWSEGWGMRGFALLPYEDYMLHAVDVWAAQLGVPVKVDLWQNPENSDTTAGLQRASEAIPLSEIRPYAIDIGNNGALSMQGNYWTTPEDVHRLFFESMPNHAFAWKKRRVLLYLHGGLNDELAVARRIVAFRDVLLRNEIYPLRVMWETGAGETIKGIIGDLFTGADGRAGGVADWLEKTREGLIEAKDRSLELTAALPGSRLWREMKENARLASQARAGAMRLVAQEAKAFYDKLAPKDRDSVELHVVAHSAGSIFAAHAMEIMLQIGVPLTSFQMLAPAITVELFKSTILPLVKRGRCPRPVLYILGDKAERDDSVGPYGKSLLYLVSNAFEDESRPFSGRGVPLLGMQRFVDSAFGEADVEVARLFGRSTGTLIVAGGPERTGQVSKSRTHGGFDNDVATLNSVLHRILGHAPDPKKAFTERDLAY